MNTIPKDEFLVSSKPESLSFLNYQIVYHIQGDKKYFKSLNILKENEILKKIYLEVPVLLNENVNIQQLIINVILEQVDDKNPPQKSKSSKSKRRKSNINKEARTEAALNLFAELNK